MKEMSQRWRRGRASGGGEVETEEEERLRQRWRRGRDRGNEFHDHLPRETIADFISGISKANSYNKACSMFN